MQVGVSIVQSLAQLTILSFKLNSQSELLLQVNVWVQLLSVLLTCEQIPAEQLSIVHIFPSEQFFGIPAQTPN